MVPRPPATMAASVRRRMRTACRLRREVGLRTVAYLALRKALVRGLGVAEWFVVLEQGAPAPTRPHGLDVRWATPEDAVLLTGFGQPRAEIDLRLAAGDRALVAIRPADGRLVGYTWYRRARWDESGAEFRLASHEVWGYDLDSEPTPEGRRLLGDLGHMGMAMLQTHGVRRTLAAVDVSNGGVMRAFLRRGASVVGVVALVRIGRVSLRRERWRGGVARWRCYRGSLPVDLPGIDVPARESDGVGDALAAAGYEVEVGACLMPVAARR